MDALIFVQGGTALLLLAVATLVHEIGAPLPITPVALFIGARAAGSTGEFVACLAVMIAATVAANLAWFAAGRRHGVGVVKLLGSLSTMDANMPRTRETIERWGPLALVFGRFLPGVTVVAPPLAGALGLGAGKFIALTTLGAALYSATLLATGALLRDEVEAAVVAMDRFHSHLFVAVAVLSVAYAAWRWRRRRAVSLAGQPAKGA